MPRKHEGQGSIFGGEDRVGVGEGVNAWPAKNTQTGANGAGQQGTNLCRLALETLGAEDELLRQLPI